MYNKLYNTNHIHEQLESGSTGWIRGYCETSFLINLTGTNFLCQLILTEIIKALDDTERDTTVNKNTDMGDSVTTDAVEDGAMRDGEGTTGVVKDADAGFEDAKSGEGDTNMDMKDNSISDTGPLQDFISDPLDPAGGLQGSASTSPRESFYDMLTKKGTDKNHVDLAVAAFYSKNYTLYELLEFYSKLELEFYLCVPFQVSYCDASSSSNVVDSDLLILLSMFRSANTGLGLHLT